MVKKCFVIMSFLENYNAVYYQAIKPAVENCEYRCIRADERTGPANIPTEIITEIIQSDIIIADISENSPNVFYELGVSHSVGNKTITIVSDLENIPFDLKPYRTIGYKNDGDGLQLLRLKIEKAVRSLEATKMKLPNNLVQESGWMYFDQRHKVDENLDAIIQERKRATKYLEYLKLRQKLQNNNLVADKLVAQITTFLTGAKGSLLISIAGSGAVGKSIFSKLVKDRIQKLHRNRYSVDILPTDSYMLTRSERILQNIIGFEPRSHDLHKLFKDVESLLAGKKIQVKPYDHGTGKHLPAKTVIPSDILLLEGIYSFCPLIIPLNKGLRYYIFADKHKAKELKFIADYNERGYDIQTAFANSDAEYNAYEKYILPFLNLADFVIEVDEYWKYLGPFPKENLSLRVLEQNG